MRGIDGVRKKFFFRAHTLLSPKKHNFFVLRKKKEKGSPHKSSFSLLSLSCWVIVCAKYFLLGEKRRYNTQKSFLWEKGFFRCLSPPDKRKKEEGGFPNRISLSASLKKDFFFILLGSNMTSRKKGKKIGCICGVYSLQKDEKRRMCRKRQKPDIWGFFSGEMVVGGGATARFYRAYNWGALGLYLRRLKK